MQKKSNGHQNETTAAANKNATRAGEASLIETLESRQLLSAAPAAPAATGLLANVPEAKNYTLVYDLNIPKLGGGYNKNPVNYAVDNAAKVTKPFDRVAYYMELRPKTGGPAKWVYVSADAFTTQAAKLGVPTAASGASFQRNLNRMNVYSNVPGVAKGTNLAGGNIEFFPNSYSTGNAPKAAGASDTAFDAGDSRYGSAYGMGSMQIHNGKAGQTLFAYNDWGGLHPTQASEVGIGNGPAGAKDWTGQNTAEQYSVRRLQVLVRTGTPPINVTPAPRPTTPAPTPTPTPTPTTTPGTVRPMVTIMPLGDSITFGFDASDRRAGGGYRSKLLQSYAAGGRKLHFVGSVTDTYSTFLKNAGEAAHEGHGGFRIDQISANFNGVGTATNVSSNNGGHWIDGTGKRPALNPDVILLHAGTNDVLQEVSAEMMAKKMDVLLGKITSARPKAKLFVAAIIPINDAAQNKVVVAFNNLLKNVLVPKYQKLGKQVRFVDQYKNFVDGSGKVIAARLPDKVHPNRVGYDAIANTWYQALKKAGLT